jgi:4-hydroxy-tetrahydrodipicolinate reductase
MGAHLIKNVTEEPGLELAAVHVYDELKQELPKSVL